VHVALDATPLTLAAGGLRRYTEELSRALAVNFPEDRFLLASDQEASIPLVLRPRSPLPYGRGSAPGRNRARKQAEEPNRADKAAGSNHAVSVQETVHAALNEFPNLEFGCGPRNAFERKWWLLGLNRELARERIDVFHGTNFEVPYVPLRPSVLTLHDLSPWRGASCPRNAARVRARTPWLIRLGIATMVVTPSEAIRREAIDRFGIHPARIVVVPLAASSVFQPVADASAATGSPYFLYAGTLEHRKNLGVLLEAWRTVRRGCAVDLVLAGQRRAEFPELPPEPGLKVLGEVSDAELRALYAGALAFVFPSLYEGFGLPVLEAMQCGAAVFTSRDAAISEVVSDAAIRIEAGEGKGWVQALESAAARPEWLATLRAKSIARAREFSWARTARLTRDTYEEARRRFAS